MSLSTESDQDSHSKCFHDWMDLQERDLSELLQGLNLNNADGEDDRGAELSRLIEENIRHFQEYVDQRASKAPHYVCPYFCPSWCTSLESSVLWAGGCRPSKFIRLIYTLSGRETLLRLQGHPQGSGRGALGDISADQMVLINSLQLKTIRAEDKISSKLASLQEEIADQPIAIIAKELPTHGEASAEADEALKALEVSMTSMLQEADSLRIDTL